MSYLCMILQLREYGAFCVPFLDIFEHLAFHQISFIVNHTSREKNWLLNIGYEIFLP
jgi:hypothetical protein